MMNKETENLFSTLLILRVHPRAAVEMSSGVCWKQNPTTTTAITNPKSESARSPHDSNAH